MTIKCATALRQKVIIWGKKGRNKIEERRQAERMYTSKCLKKKKKHDGPCGVFRIGSDLELIQKSNENEGGIVFAHHQCSEDCRCSVNKNKENLENLCLLK